MTGRRPGGLLAMGTPGTADRQGAEGVLDLCEPQAGPHELWVSARAATAAHVRANFPFSVPRWVPTGAF